MTDVLERSCGDCDLCCSAMGIIELSKPAGPRCEFQNEGCAGCKIYGDHPPTCQDFKCVWREGALPEEYQPSKVGFLMYQSPVHERVLNIMVDAERPDAWRELAGRRLITAMAKNFVIMIGLGNQMIALACPGQDTIFTKAGSPHLFDGLNLTSEAMALVAPTLSKPLPEHPPE